MKIKIDGQEYECNPNETILQVARRNGIKIPTLCYQEDFKPRSVCRICVVDVNGKLLPSCSTRVKDGMVVNTQTEPVLKARRIITELILSKNEHTSLINKKHELYQIVADMGIQKPRFKKSKKNFTVNKGVSIVFDSNRCIGCGRCVQACSNQNVNAIDVAYRSYHTKVSIGYERPVDKSVCVNCGQCLLSCPVGAIYENYSIEECQLLISKKKHVVVQTAPAARVALGEEFDLEPGTLVTGKMVAALRKLGFTKVFDTQLGADLTIMEEAAEFIERLEHNRDLPLLTSCCPAWVKYVEHFYPHLVNHLSTCKSPHEMLSAIIKSYYAHKFNVKLKDLVVVSIMPCIAKKFEIKRPIDKSVDIVLTVRELASLIKRNNIGFNSLPDEEFDSPLGLSSGAATLFGATGGVMEAALRTAYETSTGKKLEMLEFNQIRGLKYFKDGEIIINGRRVRFAVVSGLHQARFIMEDIKHKRCPYDFIEVMACPGGCIAGGGQPIPTTKEIVEKRMNGLYYNDSIKAIRRAHENPAIIELYESFLKRPLSKKSHKLLHTKYIKRGI